MKTHRRAVDQERRGLIVELLKKEFGLIHPLWVERHLGVLTSLRKTFGNDLDKVIILGVIGQFMFENADYSSREYADHVAGGHRIPSGRLTNVESVASSAELPRESVRRKVGELLDIGWLTRDEKGGLLVTAKAAAALDDPTQHTFRLLADMFVEILAILEDRGLAELHLTPHG